MDTANRARSTRAEPQHWCGQRLTSGLGRGLSGAGVGWGRVITSPLLLPSVCVSPWADLSRDWQVGERQALAGTETSSPRSWFSAPTAPRFPNSRPTLCPVCPELGLSPVSPSLVSLHGRQMEILEDRKERSGRERSRRGRKGAGLMKPCHSRATEMGEVFAAAGEKRTRSCVISDTREAVSASKTLQSGDSRGRGTQA